VGPVDSTRLVSSGAMQRPSHIVMAVAGRCVGMDYVMRPDKISRDLHGRVNTTYAFRGGSPPKPTVPLKQLHFLPPSLF